MKKWLFLSLVLMLCLFSAAALAAGPDISVTLNGRTYTAARNGNTGITVQAGSGESLWPSVSFPWDTTYLEVAVFNAGGYEVPTIKYQNYANGERSGRTRNFIEYTPSATTNPYVPGFFFPADMQPGDYWLTAIADNAYGRTEVRIQIQVTGQFMHPMKGYSMSNNFGHYIQHFRRNDDGTYREYHTANDYVYKSDANIYAFASGKVVKAGPSKNGSNGNVIIVQHQISGRTVYAFYAHLSAIYVRTGDTITTGQVIGQVGNTGTAAGSTPHLHFSIVDKYWDSGEYYGYATNFTGNTVSYGGVTFYNPSYIIEHGRLP